MAIPRRRLWYIGFDFTKLRKKVTCSQFLASLCLRKQLFYFSKKAKNNAFSEIGIIFSRFERKHKFYLADYDVFCAIHKVQFSKILLFSTIAQGIFNS